MTSTEAKQDLTFGVEIEVLCVFKNGIFRKFAADINETDRPDEILLSGVAIRHFILEAGLPVYHAWADRRTSDVDSFSRWIIGQDVHRLTRKEQRLLTDDYEEAALEIVSPVLDFNDEGSFQQIQRVLELLAAMELEFDCKFLVNKSCGLHVHMACGRDGGVPFALTKRIFQLTTAHEHNLDVLHAVSRTRVPTTSEDPNMSRFWYFEGRVLSAPYMPLSYFHRGGPFEPNNHNVFDWLQRIEEARSIEHIVRIFQIGDPDDPWCGHDAAVNFDNLESLYELGPPKTIEFRQHAGTLDAVEIANYVRLLGHIFTYCHQASDEQFYDLMLKATDRRFTADDLMKVFHGPEQTFPLVAREESSPSQVIDSTTHRGPLGALMIRNARDVAANLDRRLIDSNQSQKFQTGLYGVYENSPALNLRQSTVPNILRKNMSSALATAGLDEEEASSRARAATYGELAAMYRTLY